MLKKLRAPKFWMEKGSSLAYYLLPFSKLYSFFSSFEFNEKQPQKISVPVICVGNIVLGGAGKTPTVDLLCDILRKQNFIPHILTGGYGGYLKNVVRVNPSIHSYLQVGDESLLLAMSTPTWVGKNRTNSARAAILAGSNILVMDDGFQNNSIEKDLKILVIDSKQEFGNEHIFPAGPLRESIESGVKKSDIVLIVGERNEDIEKKVHCFNKDIQIFYATIEPTNIFETTNKRVIGFCGLGYPKKFKKTIIDCGLELLDFIEFSDHHPYTITEIQKLIKAAKNNNATLITTMKDFVKIPEVFKPEISVITIKLVPEDNFLTFISGFVTKK